MYCTASFTEAAFDPLVPGLIIAGPLGMLQRVSKRAYCCCITLLLPDSAGLHGPLVARSCHAMGALMHQLWARQTHFGEMRR
ncbi:hypothetical protein DPEC_G00035420 [Dallia pectoralis]|uniref:Uncharacterized protein n=1 Tax=Dallia pectoralis TaxID=75939 RepID=A0ACC2HDB0_DALPE|nr:hypothetical protein DPEC_G00035420 [Dallia pectoralis]